jgi:hypothetical protein
MNLQARFCKVEPFESLGSNIRVYIYLPFALIAPFESLGSNIRVYIYLPFALIAQFTDMLHAGCDSFRIFTLLWHT